MKLNNKILPFLFFFLPLSVFSAEYHVASTGNDANSGTLNNPFRNIQAAVNKMQPGDICIVHTGTYRENIYIDQSGTSGKPLIIMAAKGENPVISGLDILTLKWKATDKKGIFVADYSGAEFEQLFCDGKPLLLARWPNVPRDKNGDWDFFSLNLWAAVDSTGNNYGIIHDSHLIATGWNVTGATAILNVGHQFFTWTRTVEKHALGSDELIYPKNLGKSIKPADETGKGLKFNDDRYYLVGKKEFLDAPGEWYYDTAKKQLFFCSLDGKIPTKSIFEMKTRNYAFTAPEANYLTVDGFTFFGTAFKFGKDLKNRSRFITFTNNRVLYSSWTESFSMPDDDPKVGLDKNFPQIYGDNVVLSNNVFSFGALSALFINGFCNLIENNEFNDFDLNSSLFYPPLLVSKNQASFDGKSGNAVIRYNSIYNSGGILTQIGQKDNDFYLNDLHDAFRSCYGGNKDVSALYSQSVYCRGTRLHHNWVHEAFCGTPPYEWNGGIGIRGDDNTTGLTVDHNVVWNIGSVGIMMKNPAHPTPEQANRVLNNTIFQHSKFNTPKTAIIVSTEGKSKKGDAETDLTTTSNQFSLVDNNLAEQINGGWFNAKLATVADYTANAIGITVENQLVNPALFDFRPKATSTNLLNKGKQVEGYTSSLNPSIGAYERADSIYWIPGRRDVKASFPIVPNGATVSADRDILMWRPAYKAVSHQLYFGTDANKLENIKKFTGEKNVFTLPKLAAGQKYFWRVDAVLADGSAVKGDVWSFTTK